MKNILIVDDEATLLVIMEAWFASAHPKAGYNILVANNGIEAIKILKRDPIHLLITDLNMPKMDGLGLLTQMNNSFKEIPIIVMSSFASENIKNKVGKLGALLFITKPVTFDDFNRIDFENILNPRSADGQRGYIQGITLHSFLQLVNLDSRTCSLTIKSKGKSGQIFINKGDLMNAKTANLAGNKAAQEIISWNNAGLTIEIEDSCSETEKNVDHTIMSLLMESSHREGEGSVREAGIGDELSGVGPPV